MEQQEDNCPEYSCSEDLDESVQLNGKVFSDLMNIDGFGFVDRMSLLKKGFYPIAEITE